MAFKRRKSGAVWVLMLDTGEFWWKAFTKMAADHLGKAQIYRARRPLEPEPERVNS